MTCRACSKAISAAAPAITASTMPCTAWSMSRRMSPAMLAAGACATRSPRRSSPARRTTRSTCRRRSALHLKVLRSPHPHARIKSIKRDKALAVPGVVAVFTWEDVPRKLYSTATHEDHLVDPDDTYMLDNVVRFVGQRVAAVVAETEGAAEEACRLLEVDYELLTAGVRSGSRHGAGRADPARERASPFATTSMSTFTASSAASRRALRQADAIHEMTYSTSRVQHVHLETHGCARLAGRRWPAACAHELAGAVHRQAEALLPVRAVRPRRACLHRAHRRRLRRQAGDDLRGSVRARHAQDAAVR